MLKPFCDVCGNPIPEELVRSWQTSSHTSPNIVIQIVASKELTIELFRELDQLSRPSVHSNPISANKLAIADGKQKQSAEEELERLRAENKQYKDWLVLPDCPQCRGCGTVIQSDEGGIRVMCDCASALRNQYESQLQSAREDSKRLDWLARNQTINYGLSVGGYYYKSDLRWQETRIREAIDAALAQITEKK